MDDLEVFPKVTEVIYEIQQNTITWQQITIKISHHTHSTDIQHKGLDQVRIWMTLKHFPRSEVIYEVLRNTITWQKIID